MRAIKFRAWNGEEMINPDYIDRKGLAHWSENSIPTYTDKVMLWSGLLDKQGKEIYDGDIVERTNSQQTSTRFGEKTRHEVYFDDGSFLLKEKVQGYPGYAGIFISMYLTDKDIEIIGNIYEHKGG